jgi:hypothetical protein
MALSGSQAPPHDTSAKRREADLRRGQASLGMSFLAAKNIVEAFRSSAGGIAALRARFRSR